MICYDDWPDEIKDLFSPSSAGTSSSESVPAVQVQMPQRHGLLNGFSSLSITFPGDLLSPIRSKLRRLQIILVTFSNTN